MSPPDGEPPPLAGICFIVAVASLYKETLAAIYIGGTGDEEVGYYKASSYMASRGAHALQHVAAGVGYVATAVVAASSWSLFESQEAPPLSPTIQAVLALLLAFFLVHVLLWAITFTRTVLRWPCEVAHYTLLAARVGVSLNPLLCALFLGARMRALQISENRGSPQWWEQDFLYLCVGATFMQVFCCLMLPFFTNAATSIGSDGLPVYDLRPMVGAYAVTLVKYVALLCLHGGVAGICIAVFSMTPETVTADRPSSSDFWKSLARSLFWWLMALLVAAFLSSAKVVGLAVKFGIESVDQVFLNADITVGSAVLSLCRGYVNVRDLVVQNPVDSDFTSDYLLRIGLMIVKIDMWRLIHSLGKSFEISKLVIQDVDVNYELGTNGGASNVATVIAFMESGEADAAAAASDAIAASSSSEAPPPPPQRWSATAAPPPPISPPPPTGRCKVSIGRLCIKDMHGVIVHPKLGRVGRLDLGDLDFPDFSTRASTDHSGQYVAFVLKTLLASVVSNAGIMGSLLTAGAKQVVTSVAGGLGSIASKACGGPCGGLANTAGRGDGAARFSPAEQS